MTNPQHRIDRTLKKRYIKLSAIALALILLIVFIIQNAAVVEIKVFFWSLSMRRAIVILGVFALGFLTAWITRGIIAHREMKRLNDRYIELVEKVNLGKSKP